MKKLFPSFVFCVLMCSCSQGQPASTDKSVGGPCDRCDDMYAGMPAAEKIPATLQLSTENEPGERMMLEGMVFKKDGKTPAADIILYLYHTDAKGLYSIGEKQVHAKQHGHLRGWVKTDDHGRFVIRSIRPAAYPERTFPAHIHIMVKEPGKTRYYIDEVWFDDDRFVTKELLQRAEKRGGEQVIHLNRNNNTWTGKLVITLGMNIPGYD